VIPVEDMTPGPCGWCRHTHPDGTPHVIDPAPDPRYSRPTEEEPTDEHPSV